MAVDPNQERQEQEAQEAAAREQAETTQEAVKQQNAASQEAVRKATEEDTEKHLTQQQLAQNSQQIIDMQNLGPLQQLVMTFLMAFAKMSPELSEALGIDKVLGFETVEDYRQYREEHIVNDTWQKNPPPSLDVDGAKELLRSGNIDISQRQEQVADAIPAAAEAAGVSPQFMSGLWGVESGYGTNRLSPTGCLGDWQFTKGTFRHVMEEHGDEIAEHLRENGQEELADQMLEDMKNDKTLLAMRDNPTISTYASAYYVKEVAEDVGADPMNDQDWGKIYAGYNIGPGNARKLDGSLENVDNVKSHLGSVARHNPKFFTNGASGAEALENYRNEIVRHVRDLDGPEEETTQVASKEPSPEEGSTPEQAEAVQVASAEYDIPETLRKPEPETVSEGSRASFTAELGEDYEAITSAYSPINLEFNQKVLGNDVAQTPKPDELTPEQERKLAMSNNNQQQPGMSMGIS